jgi:hypothetical protein
MIELGDALRVCLGDSAPDQRVAHISPVSGRISKSRGSCSARTFSYLARVRL